MQSIEVRAFPDPARRFWPWHFDFGASRLAPAAGGEITVAEKASETSTAIETTRFRRADLREAQQCMYE